MAGTTSPANTARPFNAMYDLLVLPSEASAVILGILMVHLPVDGKAKRLEAKINHAINFRRGPSTVTGSTDCDEETKLLGLRRAAPRLSTL